MSLFEATIYIVEHNLLFYIAYNFFSYCLLCVTAVDLERLELCNNS